MNSKNFIKFISGKWKISRTINQFGPHLYSQSQLNRIRQLSIESQNQMTKLPQFSVVNRLEFAGMAECIERQDINNDARKQQQKEVSEQYWYEQRLILKSNNNKQLDNQGHQPMRTQRKYIYTIQKTKQNMIWKLFQDRNVFQQIDLNSYKSIVYGNNTYLAFNTKHCCLKDIYFGQYLIPKMLSFSQQSKQFIKYSLKYRVIGPTKNYQIQTNYDRVQQ